jgi:N-acyl-D-aspartate/D-glutamate deacylase
MVFDLVIRNGLIVDGSGAAGYHGDVAVNGDRIVATGEVDGTGREEIDADGLVVAPGFVDGHTHMDAQVFWDQLGSSSCYQGVTTVVMGNCGYTIAPIRGADRELVTSHIERAEDIPASAMDKGIPFGWSTFAEYLDAVDALPKGINYGGSIGHSALRIWAMGERAFEQAASADDLAAMKRELGDALRAGAMGFTTTRNPAHTTSQERPVASRLAAWREVVELVGFMGRQGTGVFQTSGQPGDPGLTNVDHTRRLQELALATGVPVVLPAARLDETLRIIDDTVARGGRMWGLTHSRGVGIMQSFETRVSFDKLPEWQDVRRKPLEQQRVLLKDPDVRARLIAAARDGQYRPGAAAEPFKPDYDKIHVMYSPYLQNPTVAQEARKRGVDPAEAMIDIALEHDFHIFFPQILGFEALGQDELVSLFRNPNTAMTFSDSGAHLNQVADASIQTHLLAYWVRERHAFTIEEAIRMITLQPARMWRLSDRGMLAPGYAADITIFDPGTVAPLVPDVVHDLPGGASRLEQRAVGYVATVVNGQVFTRDGVATEARAGRLLRAGQLPVPAA